MSSEREHEGSQGVKTTPYKMWYNLGAGPITKEQALERGLGAADEVILCSVLSDDDGGASYLWCSGTQDDGKKREVKPRVLFNAAMVLLSQLGEDPNLDEERRMFAKSIFLTYRDHMKKAREAASGAPDA